jgi:pimeloyl-ACP methyl ester carboxylesterase
MTTTPDERPVYVERRGERLFGILHVPAPARATAVVFLSSGLQNRAGPHRMYVKAARRFAEDGFVSLRLDLPGVGDSAERPLEANFDCHDDEPVAHATKHLTERHGVERIVLLGLCAGARVALRAAVRDPRVAGVVAWSAPVVSGPVNMPVAKGGGAYMGRTQAKRQLREWAPKLVNPVVWYRYLAAGKSLGSGWAMMRRAMSGLLPERFRPTSDRQNDFLYAVTTLAASPQGRLLFVYGEEDTVARGELAERFPTIARNASPRCELVVVPGGDHTFTRAASTDEAIARTADWLIRHFPN